MTQVSQRDFVLGLLLAFLGKRSPLSTGMAGKTGGELPQEVRDIVWSKSLPEAEPYTQGQEMSETQS